MSLRAAARHFAAAAAWAGVGATSRVLADAFKDHPVYPFAAQAQGEDAARRQGYHLASALAELTLGERPAPLSTVAQTEHEVRRGWWRQRILASVPRRPLITAAELRARVPPANDPKVPLP